MTTAQMRLILLLTTVATKALKVGLLTLSNIKRVQGMSDEEVRETIVSEEARSQGLDSQLDAH